jgi:hypothetical protein
MESTESFRREIRNTIENEGLRDIRVTETLVWEYSVMRLRGYFDDRFFLTPDVKYARPSNRFLVVGSETEIEHMQNLLKEMTSRCQVDVTYCSYMIDLWKCFFGNDKYLDYPKQNTKPKSIVATGNITSYDGIGKMTRKEPKRLEKIADKWRMPIHFIGPVETDNSFQDYLARLIS